MSHSTHTHFNTKIYLYYKYTYIMGNIIIYNRIGFIIIIIIMFADGG